MNKYIGWLATGLFMVAPVTYANNIEIDSCWIVQKNTAQHYYTIGFKLSWENSYRDSTNYDAVWVFIKYQKASVANTWFHATVDTLDASHQVWSPAVGGMMVDASFGKDNWGTGVMIYRTNPGESDINCDSAHIRWYYNRGQIMTDADSCTGLRVFGIEMVYIPQGNFFVGDTSIYSPIYAFYRYKKIENSPYQITSEGSIQMGQTEGYLRAGSDFSAGTLPAAYPKGYTSFYIMRYEMSQAQYVDFLNTIESVAADSLFPDHYGENRYWIRKFGNVYGCDANGNGCVGDLNDGDWTACNYITPSMACCYLDWSGLRPFTELEYEKTCRGPKYPVAGEYAWGTTTKSAGIIEFACTDSERITPATTNYCETFPYRCGGCAYPTTNRVESGASYYGVMDLTSNLLELCISVYTTTHISFTGNHGDGVLSTLTGWPPTFGGRGIADYPSGSSYKGWGRVSARYYVYAHYASNGQNYGIRGVRSP